MNTESQLDSLILVQPQDTFGVLERNNDRD